MLLTILLVILILGLVGALPIAAGPYPSGLITVLVIVLLVLLLTGRL